LVRNKPTPPCLPASPKLQRGEPSGRLFPPLYQGEDSDGVWAEIELQSRFIYVASSKVKLYMITLTRATLDHLEGITEIYNEAVLNTTATFDLDPASLDEQRIWFAEHGEKFPIFVAVEDDMVIGWASLSKWSGRCAYADTAEISIYIKDGFRGKGIGKMLLGKILEEGKKAGIHTIIARIADESEASIKLHEHAGFTHIGTMKEVGKKFGKLLDVHMMQIIFKP
jgi:L-amino acid N-acyltransferase YncA